jgi:hypothetical protein
VGVGSTDDGRGVAGGINVAVGNGVAGGNGVLVGWTVAGGMSVAVGSAVAGSVGTEGLDFAIADVEQSDPVLGSTWTDSFVIDMMGRCSVDSPGLMSDSCFRLLTTAWGRLFRFFASGTKSM